MCSPSSRLKPLQKTQGIANGTSGGTGQQQVAALGDISAQVQQYQQFLGETPSVRLIKGCMALQDFIKYDLFLF